MKKKKQFQFEVIFTAQEEGGFTAEVPDLPGCISEGDTFEEAKYNIIEAIELYLDTLAERGVDRDYVIPAKAGIQNYKLNKCLTNTMSTF